VGSDSVLIATVKTAMVGALYPAGSANHQITFPADSLGCCAHSQPVNTKGLGREKDPANLRYPTPNSPKKKIPGKKRGKAS